MKEKYIIISIILITIISLTAQEGSWLKKVNKEIVFDTIPEYYNSLIYKLTGSFNNVTLKNVVILQGGILKSKEIDNTKKRFSLEFQLKSGLNKINFYFLTVQEDRLYRNFKINVDNTPPEIKVVSNDVVNNRDYRLLGVFKEENLKDIKIKPDNTPVKINKEKQYYYAYLFLKRPQNKYTISITDLAGNQTDLDFTVAYDTGIGPFVLEPYNTITKENKITIKGRIVDLWIKKINTLPEYVPVEIKPEDHSFSLEYYLTPNTLNVFYLEALDIDGDHKKYTYTCKVFMDNKPPEIQIEKNNLKISRPTSAIVGTYNDDFIDTIMVKPYSDVIIDQTRNRFVFDVNISQETTPITIIAKDMLGSVTEKEYKIIYSDTSKIVLNISGFIGVNTEKSELKGKVNRAQLSVFEIEQAIQAPVIDEKTGDFKVLCKFNLGINNIKIYAKDKLDAEFETTVLVLYDNIKPEINLNEMPDEVITKEILVEGNVIEKNLEDLIINVNEKKYNNVVLDKNGIFKQWIDLEVGDNNIRVMAIDKSNNKSSIEITIKYNRIKKYITSKDLEQVEKKIVVENGTSEFDKLKKKINIYEKIIRKKFSKAEIESLMSTDAAVSFMTLNELYSISHKYYKNQEYKKALEYINIGCKNYSDKAWLWNYAGYTLVLLKDYENAMIYFCKALNIDEKDVYYTNLAFAALNLNKYMIANAGYQKALYLNSEKSQAVLGLSYLKQMNKYKELNDTEIDTLLKKCIATASNFKIESKME